MDQGRRQAVAGGLRQGRRFAAERWQPGLFDANGRRIAALIVVGFKERLDMRTLKRIGDACVREAAALSVQLGRREAVA